MQLYQGVTSNPFKLAHGVFSHNTDKGYLAFGIYFNRGLSQQISYTEGTICVYTGGGLATGLTQLTRGLNCLSTV